jgi:enoyl-CoA hydratase/3-hydroxyacyl-CoA dehydrogenase
MGTKDIEKVAVLGAGTMGHGIAEVILMADYNVYLQDMNQELIDRGISLIYDSLSKFVSKGKVSETQYEKIKTELLKPCVELEQAVEGADLVIEAIPEIMALKKKIFRKIDELSPPHALLASNTSSMSITEIASATKKPENVLGLHYFTPVVMMKLTEVICGKLTSEETLDTAYEFCEKTGRLPLRVKKDVPGFIVNRVIQFPKQVLFGCILDKGIAQPEEVDALFEKSGMNMGPFAQMDYAGLDVQYNAGQYLAEVLHPDYAPSKGLEKKVKAGQLGRKTGKGFLDWSQGKPCIDSTKATDKVDPMDLMAVQINEATKLLEIGVCTAEDVDMGIIHGLGPAQEPVMAVAKGLEPHRLAQRLENIANRFGKEIFMPSLMIRQGTYR